jgi:hypothetical protein
MLSVPAGRFMRIKIPMLLVRWWDATNEFLNVPLLCRGRHELRIVDVVLFLGFVFCAVFYGLAGGVMFGVVLTLALFMRGDK